MARELTLKLSETQAASLVIALSCAQVFNRGLRMKDKSRPLELEIDPEQAAIIGTTGKTLAVAMGYTDVKEFDKDHVSPFIHETIQDTLEWLKDVN